MKIVNETPEDMTLMHPSVAQAAIGGVFLILGAALFISSATPVKDALLISQAAFVCFAFGLLALFTNANETVDLNKTTGEIRYRVKHFMGAETATYPINTVTRVELKEPFFESELAPGLPRAKRSYAKPLISEAFLVLHDGTRVLIDYEHRHLGRETAAQLQAESDTSIAGRVARFLNVPIEDRNAYSKA